MKAKKLFSILHFSDLHFGEFFMQGDEIRPGDFSNYFSRFQSKVKYIIKNEIVDLVIISGDFCSKNLFFTNGKIKKKLKRRKPLKLPIHLRSFLDNFKNKNIPIIICIGNHEIDREIKKHELRTLIYRELKESIEDYMNSDFSIKFDQNFINYKVYENEGILAFSIDTTFSLREKKWNYPRIDLKGIIEFFDELDSNGINYSSYKKILVCHHPLREIRNFEDIKPYLVEKKIELIFSGHFHDKYVDIIYPIGTKNLILNLIAGSPFLNLEKRFEGKSWNPASLQFNCYVLSGLNWDRLLGDYYIYNDNNIWEKKELLLLFNISQSFQTWLERIIEQTKNHPSEERIKILKENGNQTEIEELNYISWVFNEFINKYSFELKEIKLICKYFGNQVEQFFSCNQNIEIIEKVLINASIDIEEKSKEFLENLKQGEKIWLGTVQEFKQYLIDVFNLNKASVEKVVEKLFEGMVIGSSPKTISLEIKEKLEDIKYIESLEKIKSTLEIINGIFSDKMKDLKLRRKIYRELGFDITDLNKTLLGFAAQSLASSYLEYEGIFLFKWREKLLNLIQKYVNRELKDKITRSSNINDYVEMISDYTLILAKDDIEMVI